MGRKCSHCGNHGHNSRTCSGPGGTLGAGVRIFGVQLYAASSSSPMKKSFSTNCLSSSCNYAASSSSPSSSSSSSSLICLDELSVEKISGGYLSEGLMGRAQERKKGEKRENFDTIVTEFCSVISLFEFFSFFTINTILPELVILVSSRSEYSPSFFSCWFTFSFWSDHTNWTDTYFPPITILRSSMDWGRA